MKRFLTEQDEVNANRTDPAQEAAEDAVQEERYARRQSLATPQLGHAVDLPDGGRAVVSVLYTPTQVGLCRLEDVYGGRFFYGPNVGPPRPDVEEHVSVSGGPHPFYPVDHFELTGGTAEVKCWHWEGLPRAQGGVDYTRTVPLWRLNEPGVA